MIIDEHNFKPKPLCHIGGTQIAVLPDIKVVPHGQWSAIENTPVGRGLAMAIDSDGTLMIGRTWIICPHNADTDRMLTDLSAACQEIKRAAPVPVQRALFVEAGDAPPAPLD